jgi:hypothetical protein
MLIASQMDVFVDAPEWEPLTGAHPTCAHGFNG